MILAYTLSLFPMLLITLAIHELGHLAMARINRVKPNRFQIGIGKNLITRYTGRTRIAITPETETPSGLSAGETTDVYVTRKPGEEGYTAGAIIPLRERTGDEALEALETHQRYQDSHMKLTGRIRQTSPEEITLADMAWSLRAVPIDDARSLQHSPVAKTGQHHPGRAHGQHPGHGHHPGTGGSAAAPGSAN